MNLDRKCIDQCDKCSYNINGFCEKFLCPEAKWRAGKGISCGMATHIAQEIMDEGRKKRAGQQKTKQQKAIVRQYEL